ncbi:hypothetical protein BC629DRAFT_1507007 [Irpex lacteus]|nr:hypothetical protein BC629DRAFT_1507007 [Irpex lacteus]
MNSILIFLLPAFLSVLGLSSSSSSSPALSAASWSWMNASSTDGGAVGSIGSRRWLRHASNCSNGQSQVSHVRDDEQVDDVAMPRMCRRIWVDIPKRVVGAVREDERGRWDLRCN